MNMKRLLIVTLAGLALLPACRTTQPAPEYARIRANATIAARPAVAGIDTGTTSAASGEVQVATSIQVTTSGVSQAFESSLVNGMADFVVSRAKAEVISYVVSEFGKDLCRPDGNWDVATFFPNTCDLVVGRDDVASLSVRQLGTIFRVALLKDLERLLPEAFNATLRTQFPDRMRHQREVSLRLADLLEGVEAGENPIAMLVTRGSGFPCGKGRAALGCAFRMVGLSLEAMITVPSDDLDWLDDEQTQALLTAATVRLRARLGADKALTAWWKAKPQPDLLSYLGKVITAARRLERKARWAESDRQPGVPVDPAVRRLTAGVFKAAFTVRKDTDALAALEGSQEAIYALDEWLGAGRAMIAVIDGLWRGENPIALTVAAAKIIPCRGADDVSCGFRVVALGLAAILSEAGTSWDTFQDGTAAADAVKSAQLLEERMNAIATKLDDLVKNSGDVHLRRWYDKHCSSQAVKAYFMQRLFMAARRTTAVLRQLIDAPVHELEKRRAMAMELVTTALGIWQNGLSAILPPDKRERAEQLINSIQAAKDALARGDVGGYLVALYSTAKELGVPDPFPPAVRRYMPLIVDLLAARQARDVSAALERYAEPIGAWRRKRASRFMASLTSFVGATGGAEWVDGQQAGEVAMFAPIGVDISTGAWGLYASVIDLGTLTAARLDGEDVEAPNASVVQVLSPGLFLRWAPFKSPFVIGVGASAVPGLRGPDSEQSKLAVRVHAFAAVDVTILAF